MIAGEGNCVEIACAKFQETRKSLRSEEGLDGRLEENEIGGEKSFVVKLTSEQEREEVECLSYRVSFIAY